MSIGPRATGRRAILALPLLVWVLRRLLARVFPSSRIWGVERPALETWTAILAFAPVVGWLGNPAWWRETLPRLAHYYTLSTDRRSALPDIQIIYFGQTYEFTLPWHNAWVLLGITVPVTILLAGAIGIVWGLGQIRRDRLPLYFLVHFLTLPVLRMLPTTPAHDGVRLFLPTFFFLAAFAGWGTVALARGLARWLRRPLTVVVSGPGGLRAGARGLEPGAHSPVRALLLQRAHRRAAGGLASGLRADLLVGCLQRPDARRAESDGFLPEPRSISPTS